MTLLPIPYLKTAFTAWTRISSFIECEKMEARKNGFQQKL